MFWTQNLCPFELWESVCERPSGNIFPVWPQALYSSTPVNICSIPELGLESRFHVRGLGTQNKAAETGSLRMGSPPTAHFHATALWHLAWHLPDTYLNLITLFKTGISHERQRMKKVVFTEPFYTLQPHRAHRWRSVTPLAAHPWDVKSGTDLSQQVVIASVSLCFSNKWKYMHQ